MSEFVPDRAVPTPATVREERPEKAQKLANDVLKGFVAGLETFLPGNLVLLECGAPDVRDIVRDYLSDLGWFVSHSPDTTNLVICDVEADQRDVVNLLSR